MNERENDNYWWGFTIGAGGAYIVSGHPWVAIATVFLTILWWGACRLIIRRSKRRAT